MALVLLASVQPISIKPPFLKDQNQGSDVSSLFLIGFLIGLVLLATLGHGYWWVDVVNRLHAWPGPRKLVDGATMLCMFTFLAVPVLVVATWNQLDLTTVHSSHPKLLWLRSYVFLCAIWGFFKLIICGVNSLGRDDPRTLLQGRQENLNIALPLSKDEFHGKFSQLLAKVPGNQVFQLTVDHKRLAIPRLSAHHEGLKIAHISDLHMTGRIGPKWYEVVAEQVNQLQADAIVITGDLVEQEACWPWLADSLGRLRAKQGVFFIMGNHDFYVDTDRTRQLLRDQGLTCLSGCWIEKDWNGAPVILAGNERPWGPQVADLSAVPSKDSEQLPLKLMLLHTPDQFNWACDQEADLAFAGHTHGGQIRFPLLGPIACPSNYGTRYACGVFRRRSTVMHVTRGICGKTPLRLNCPPEIALLELAAG